MDFKEYLFLLLIIIITAIFSSYFTYRILNNKIQSVISELEYIKNGNKGFNNVENFNNSNNNVGSGYNSIVDHNISLQQVGLSNDNKQIDENCNKDEDVPVGILVDSVQNTEENNSSDVSILLKPK